MSELVVEKGIMSNVSAKLYDEKRTVDTLYLEPELKKFATSLGKRTNLSLTYVVSRIIEFCVENKSSIYVDENQLENKISKTGLKTTVRVKKNVYSSFTRLVEQLGKQLNREVSRSAYLNMILRKMYEKQEPDNEFSAKFLEQVLII
ncbi:hypothetical protein [Acinetobacter baumannii]|uniref:hypothetical protein n=1 Tax=Acinetobacter baumannii TaxID=470 RepID=UPI0007E96916|nr:hypothetical protein [Acinetobacter baumannii]EKT9247989.1 hypothetical protein [Acinetobacter baumannii]EKV8039584.1 hypothetical protein [Acinetobacter baumannii]MBE2308739.1 hypothetical protein [Acinetobacter baumannii]MBE2653637.1 hypothetical protein [Acinetobacter baumannii]MBE2668421.1 hypothetical protein [Acinetobacter baumannii]